MAIKRNKAIQSKSQPIDAATIDLSQVDLTNMSLMSLLQFGSGMLLKHAITSEITEYLGRSHYQRGSEFKGHRNGSQLSRIDTPLGVVEYSVSRLYST